MFVEFDSDTLREWNGLTEEEKERSILNDEVQVAVDVAITIENNNRVVEEHKYYQVCNNTKLINNISILKISVEETTFSINTHDDSKRLIAVKLEEERNIDIGNIPYLNVYKIKVSNIKYGKIVEL